jgi:methyl-accepting chemotaxis protein
MSVVVEKVNLTQESSSQTAETIEIMASNSVEAAKGNQDISDISRQQLDQFGLLQSNIWMLFVTLKENGTKVEATAAIGEDLRRLSGRLNELMAGFQFSHEIAINTAQHEQRKAPRANNSMLVKIVQGDDFLDALILDFSLTGARLSLARKLDVVNPMDMKVYLPYENLREYESQIPIELKGNIAWQEEQEGRARCTAGVQFIGLQDSDRDKIKQCFDFFNLQAEFTQQGS